MIRRACYVVCDICGDPAEISTDGSKLARVYAANDGFVRRDGRDICSNCKDKA